MESEDIPQPGVMPIDREAWRNELHLSNFVNSYCQFRDINSCKGVKSILVIGPGQGLDTAVFRWRGYQVTTFDIDDTFNPDIVGSCHEMPMFANGQFDAVIASHVLEHLPEPYLDRAIAELARVADYALVYLPVSGRTFHLRFSPGILGIDWSLLLDLRPFWHKPDGVASRYCQGQHYWEVGLRGYRPKDLIRRFSGKFDVLNSYRNRDWTPSYNFVMHSKARSTTQDAPAVKGIPQA